MPNVGIFYDLNTCTQHQGVEMQFFGSAAMDAFHLLQVRCELLGFSMSLVQTGKFAPERTEGNCSRENK